MRDAERLRAGLWGGGGCVPKWENGVRHPAFFVRTHSKGLMRVTNCEGSSRRSLSVLAHQLSPTADWEEWHPFEMIAEVAGKLTRGMNPLTPLGATPEWTPTPRFL